MFQAFLYWLYQVTSNTNLFSVLAGYSNELVSYVTYQVFSTFISYKELNLLKLSWTQEIDTRVSRWVICWVFYLSKTTSLFSIMLTPRTKNSHRSRQLWALKKEVTLNTKLKWYSDSITNLQFKSQTYSFFCKPCKVQNMHHHSSSSMP